MTSPAIVAHRGAWKQSGLPQNSIAALTHAVQRGYSNVELDVHLTRDDIAVVNHDHDFYGIPIDESTYAELGAKAHPNGEKIPRLDDFLLTAKELSAALFLEIKSSRISLERTLELTEITIDLVRQAQLEKSVHYISFEQETLQKVLLLDAAAMVSYLRGDLNPAQIAEKGWHGFDYHVRVLHENPQWISQAQQHNVLTNVWTVNSEEEMRHFAPSGIDFITTDEPELLEKHLTK